MSNTNLNDAKKAKNDEFYTMYKDIENELQHYPGAFEEKIVYCNCDNPEWSNFWKYFHLNFEKLGLKKLISTHYEKDVEANGHPYKMEYEGGNDADITAGVKTPLDGNGDFASDECIKVLNEADVVVTNPPFSEFRPYVVMLMENNKNFIIWGNNNAIGYKDIFPFLKNNKIWLGHIANKTCKFRIPASYEKYDKKTTEKVNDGNKYCSVNSVSVFTNIDLEERHKEITLTEKYDPQKHLNYDNYQAINVDRCKEIPYDYCESWEVTKEEFKMFSAEKWEIIRETENSLFIIPARRTQLRQKLHEHTPGYKDEIEKELLRYKKKDTATESLECQSHSLPSTTHHSLKSLEQQNQKEKDLATDYGLQNQELHSLLSTSSENINACLQERYCNGIIGVPVTFIGQYNPSQFSIIGHDHDINGDGGKGIYEGQFEAGGKGKYKRILIRKIL